VKRRSPGAAKDLKAEVAKVIAAAPGKKKSPRLRYRAGKAASAGR
jgi:hypothetical protein